MEEFDIYKDISERTNGDIYIGVVGPVRAGKSTFITNFMEKLVVPKIADKNVRERMKDELPQSANGKTIMTTQPKFVPGEAVEINISDNVTARIRLVDCVGYLIDGAVGHLDGDKQRMVRTPWSDHEIPFGEAADIGTRKVITDHSTIGVVMTTDGTITTDIPRKNYVAAEERVVGELRELGKPFVIILNSTVPGSVETLRLAEELKRKYQAAVLPLDVLNLSDEDIDRLLASILYEFPVSDIEVNVSKWMQALPRENAIVSDLIATAMAKCKQIDKMSDVSRMSEAFENSEYFDDFAVDNIALGCGRATVSLKAKPDVFYKALSDECQMELNDDFQLMACMKDLVYAKREYDKISSALAEVRETGYGVVPPSLDEMTLEEPQIVKQGSRFGVKLRATAPSLHIMRVDVESEVNPIVGTEQQSEELVSSLLSQFESDPKGIWQTNMFGKSLNVLVNDGLNNKLLSMPEDTQRKMRRTLSRIVNEGKGGIICILL